MLKKLRTIIYHVNDIAKAKEWYASLTGTQPYFDEHFYVGFEINGCELGLDPDTSKIKPGNHSVAYWSVENIQEAIEKAKRLGASVFSPVANVGGTIEVAVIEDPFGNHVGFIAGA